MKGDKETIIIDDSKVSSYSDFTNKSSVMIDRMVGGSQDKFKTLKKNQIFANGFNRIERGYSEVKQAMNQYLGVINNYYDNLDVLQKDLINIVSGIDIPKSYLLNDVVITNNKENIVLNTNSGNVANSNNLTDQVELDNESKINIENLNNINNDVTSSVNYDDSTEIQKQNINNINNGNEDNVKEYDDNYSVEKEQMNELNQVPESTVSEYDDNYFVTKEVTNNIENAQIEETGENNI